MENRHPTPCKKRSIILCHSVCIKILKKEDKSIVREIHDTWVAGWEGQNSRGQEKLLRVMHTFTTLTVEMVSHLHTCGHKVSNCNFKILGDHNVSKIPLKKNKNKNTLALAPKYLAPHPPRWGSRCLGVRRPQLHPTGLGVPPQCQENFGRVKGRQSVRAASPTAVFGRSSDTFL